MLHCRTYTVLTCLVVPRVCRSVQLAAIQHVYKNRVTPLVTIGLLRRLHIPIPVRVGSHSLSVWDATQTDIMETQLQLSRNWGHHAKSERNPYACSGISLLRLLIAQSCYEGKSALSIPSLRVYCNGPMRESRLCFMQDFFTLLLQSISGNCNSSLSEVPRNLIFGLCMGSSINTLITI